MKCTLEEIKTRFGDEFYWELQKALKKLEEFKLESLRNQLYCMVAANEEKFQEMYNDHLNQLEEVLKDDECYGSHAKAGETQNEES